MATTCSLVALFASADKVVVHLIKSIANCNEVALGFDVHPLYTGLDRTTR
ncbi:hypothetical protein PC121_g18588 [Phytophthora cactorum]|nr:hypothetical protein PC120_g20426 [Phytophthora cactorum]KAG3050084.1 hypothetical protein PC121_g18588 [Phytophthora cactorum]